MKKEWHIRETCTGFYSGAADENSLIYYVQDNNHVNHDFLGTIIGKDDRGTLLEVRNTFEPGEVLEVMTPGVGNRTFTVESIQNRDGETMTKANHPMETVWLQIPFETEDGDIVRRYR